ncbi:MAG: hypothetical protein NTV51_14425 [Verrucomicrobia bacterium]|nr:hypothetical protein [Verrucomicrobiota bacterium]
METPAQTCARLLGALEELADAEAATLRHRDFAAVADIQDRAAPLIEYLATHGPAVADNALRARVWEFLRRRAQTGEWLDLQLAEARAELQGMQASQHRVARIAPVYGKAPVQVPGQLLAVG